MSLNPEQPVLDAIAELVDWQLEEGRRRGDGPLDTFTIGNETYTIGPRVGAADLDHGGSLPVGWQSRVRPPDRWTFTVGD